MSNILIIDSEPTQLIALEAVIKGWGYRCRAAGSAKAARKRLEEDDFAYDAVLLDWGLPNSEGLELLEWINRQPRSSDLEVIIQSRRDVPQDIREAIHQGAYYYLTKPYEWPQLRALIQAAESSRDLKRSLKQRVSEIQDIVRLLDTATLELRRIDEAEVVAAHLGAAAGDPQLGIAVLELLINAVEHGNLGISYEEKSALRESGRYEQELEERLEAEENRDKLVKVVFKRVGDHLDILISDRGAGFDYGRFLDFDPNRVFDSHGRGVLLARGLLEVEFLDPGNRVRVRLPLAQPEAQAGSRSR